MPAGSRLRTQTWKKGLSVPVYRKVRGEGRTSWVQPEVRVEVQGGCDVVISDDFGQAGRVKRDDLARSRFHALRKRREHSQRDARGVTFEGGTYSQT